VFLCYIDESGTPDVPGNSSHFILAGLSIPIDKWKDCDNEISAIKIKYYLPEVEIHTAWMLRPYLEQSKITNFKSLERDQRIYEVDRLRNIEILRLQRSSNNKLYKQTKKNYDKTKDYRHLAFDERKEFIKDICNCISKWSFVRLFADCIDKVHFDPVRVGHGIGRETFEQIVTRFETYLQITSRRMGSQCWGLLIHDNNETVSKKHTKLMKEFHHVGTLWTTTITHIIETPLFVDSQLTSMVQIADLCSYVLRRYLENSEDRLFDLIFRIADRKSDGTVVGVRHFTGPDCKCKICIAHRKK
jgi:hypothetical protein